MKKREGRDTASDDLILAIGLIWGHLRAGQIEEADELARGCLRVWPDDERLGMMAAYAAVEMGRPLDEAASTLLEKCPCREWADLVLRRARRVDDRANCA